MDDGEIRLERTVVSNVASHLLYGTCTPVVWVLNILTAVHEPISRYFFCHERGICCLAV